VIDSQFHNLINGGHKTQAMLRRIGLTMLLRYAAQAIGIAGRGARNARLPTLVKHILCGEASILQGTFGQLTQDAIMGKSPQHAVDTLAELFGVIIPRVPGMMAVALHCRRIDLITPKTYGSIPQKRNASSLGPGYTGRQQGAGEALREQCGHNACSFPGAAGITVKAHGLVVIFQAHREITGYIYQG
jgi:hypothetical protein